MARDAVDERVLCGDANEVILRQFAAHHAAESEQTCGAAYGLFGIAIDFDLETMRTGALVAENQEIWLARKGFLVIPGLLGVLGWKKPTRLRTLSKNFRPLAAGMGSTSGAGRGPLGNSI